MSTGSEFPKIQVFESVLCTAALESGVALSNFPAVFRGCATHWDASSKWNQFNGDIRSHERVSSQNGSWIDAKSADLSSSMPLAAGL